MQGGKWLPPCKKGCARLGDSRLSQRDKLRKNDIRKGTGIEEDNPINGMSFFEVTRHFTEKFS